MSDDSTRANRIFLGGGEPSGFFSLSGIDEANRHAVWGGYLSPFVPRGRGYGLALIDTSLKFAFLSLNLNRVSVEVLSTNTPAIALYEKVGFQQEGLARERVIRPEGRIDVLLYGLLRREWGTRLPT